jgi:tRNA-dihydrouridine synthase
MEDAGAALICVHGRTREQMYAPGVDYHIIGEVKKSVSIPVIGNGDLRSAEDAKRMLEISGCDGFMVARGATGNPWLFAELCAWMDGKEYTPPTKEERLALAMHHAELCVADKGERIGIPEIRKHIAWYLRGMNGAAAGRNRVMTASTLDEMREILTSM